MRTRTLLDLSVYIGSGLDFAVMVLYFGLYGVRVSLDFTDPLVFVNFLITANMVFTLLFVGIYSWLRRRVIIDQMRARTRRGRDWLVWAATFGTRGEL